MLEILWLARAVVSVLTAVVVDETLQVLGLHVLDLWVGVGGGEQGCSGGRIASRGPIGRLCAWSADGWQ